MRVDANAGRSRRYSVLIGYCDGQRLGAAFVSGGLVLLHGCLCACCEREASNVGDEYICFDLCFRRDGSSPKGMLEF